MERGGRGEEWGGGGGQGDGGPGEEAGRRERAARHLNDQAVIA